MGDFTENQETPKQIILMVDQSPINLMLFQGMLKELKNIDFILFEDPFKALDWAKENFPDLVYVDYNFDLINGVDFIKQFRKIPKCGSVPLVLISAVYDQPVLWKALESGANDFITKPVDRYEFLARTKNMLALSVSQKKLADHAHMLSQEVEQATRDLKTSEERYALAAQGANDGLWDWDLVADKVFYSSRWKAMLGFKEDEISEKPEEWLKRIHPEDQETVKIDIESHLTGISEHFECEYRLRNQKGRYIWVVSRGLAVKNAEGKATRFVGSLTDTTERKKAEQRLVHDAFHDVLTGLPNRALFMDRLTQVLVKRIPHAVLFLDMDRFKNVNDSMGHKAGDELLIALSKRLEKCTRVGDTIARFGGDEFTILLTDIQGLEEVYSFANRLLEAASTAIIIQDQEIFPTLSIGVAMSDAHYNRAEEVVRDADIAMYRAKENGKGRVEIFDESMRNETIAMFKLESNLRRAIERGEIILYYQPIVNLRTGEISGFEALMRWDRPNHGIVTPGEFIPLAEETKMIVPLGRWALETACRQLVEWHKLFPSHEKLFMTVNVSGKQLEHRSFVPDILPILNQTAIKASCLKLEVTESIIMNDPDKAERVLRELKGLGVNLAIDDFGTGYSSLSYLHRYPFDTLKIDQSFISKMREDEKFVETVRIIIMLAYSLGMNVVAEGIEHEDEAIRLKELRCTYGQGYYFARPMPADQITILLNEKKSWLNVPSEKRA
ncbi:PAS and EAL domain-containing protein [Candidatus Bealeia paramacronuclearis]|uniref:PAS and EAL domain-containing protein n=1 Tax=Candidatus Bealeia paramacronuclearis TaxID=1921001 RepID=A0ABZ2C178_9PROT|nr:PAS and EAL domain-containing protein [Candidatus Bealeia paramacronuclearis]